MNWDDARLFLALGRETTLRAAARVLGVDQATVGRRIAAMEKALGTKLFLRASDGYVLTAAGEVAFGAASRMETAALELQSKLEGQDDALSGTVKVTSTDSIAIDVLIPAMATLRERHPNIRVDLEVTTQVLNLSRRQADLAIRNQKPENPDLFVRRLASWPVGLFASEDYLARRGEPVPGTEFAGHDVVGFRPHIEKGGWFTLVDEPSRQGTVAAALNAGLLIRHAVAAGLGLAEMPLVHGVRDGLVRVWPERVRKAKYDVWLVMHPDLRNTARVRAVADFFARALKDEG